MEILKIKCNMKIVKYSIKEIHLLLNQFLKIEWKELLWKELFFLTV